MAKNRHSIWRKAHPMVRNAARARNYAKSKPLIEVAKRRPTGVRHLPWEEEEKMLILRHEWTDRQMARYLKRSVKAIQTMRCNILKRLK